MAEAVVASIAGDIISTLVGQALEKVGNLRGVKQEIEMLRDTVSTLRAVLDHAEEQYSHSPEIKLWLERLKNAFYDAQDVLEELNIEALRRELRGRNEMIEEVRTFFSSSNQLAFNLKMSNKVRAVRERIESIKADRGFHLEERSGYSRVEGQWGKREETHSFTHEGDVKGRDDDKETVKKFLLDSNMKEHVSILPIVGIGGLGKTTLAQYVYNDEMICQHFHLKMWVCVSNDFDVKKIVKNIIACAKNKEPTADTMELLQSELREGIGGKRYLLVLDDLWNEELEKWSSLRKLLMGGARGSKILITTRSPLVAKITSNAPHHVLEGLSESASFDLLMQTACRKLEEMQDSDMLAIVKEIVRKCSGVPLVIRTIGSLLFFKESKHEWLQFKENELPDVSQRENSINSILKLSYDHLPPHLKQCFALCSLFPKDYEIKKQTLVDLWMAEGFIRSSNRNQHLEDIAHKYFMDLLWSNFFQDFKQNPNTKEETCKMHDLMHDLACMVAGTECWVAWDDKRPILERTRHISHDSISNLMGKFPISRLKASALRTFLSTAGYWESMSEVDLRPLIQSSKRLRILDLHANKITKVPRSISKLMHLTYLNLSHNDELKRLPNSITRLHNLQTLNLSYCRSLEELPRDIRKLVSLRNLYIDDCSKLSYVPRGLGQLSSLHRLTRFILPKNKALAKNYCELGELNGLDNIRGSLNIENLESVTDAAAESKAANLIGKYVLESLTLEWGNFGTVDAIIRDRDEALLDGLQLPSNLQKLTINRYGGERFPSWMMNGLVSSLPNLIELRLSQCGQCRRLPQLGQLPRLKTLVIEELTELECIESDDSSTSTASFPSLMRLDVDRCEKLKTMPLTPHLEELRLNKANPAWIDKISGLNKLKSLEISHMNSLGYLHEAPEEYLKSLTSLESLDISYCIQLRSLSSLGMRHLSNLVHLKISDCRQLYISEDESGDNILDFHGGLLHSLRSVHIWMLPKLYSLPRWLLQLPNLERLQIGDCRNLNELPEQIEALQSLQRLEIYCCPSLTSLPEGMRRLASLTSLGIIGCPELVERCKSDGGEDWYKIAHIPDFGISRLGKNGADFGTDDTMLDEDHKKLSDCQSPDGKNMEFSLAKTEKEWEHQALF